MREEKTMENGKPKTTNEQRTTNNEQRTTNNEQRTTNNEQRSTINDQRMRVLVTGAAGFIGYHVSKRLLDRGDEVIGVDNLNDYYDPKLKEARLALLEVREAFRFRLEDIADRDAMRLLFETDRPQWVVNLAAQAGVRYSLVNPQ